MHESQQKLSLTLSLERGDYAVNEILLSLFLLQSLHVFSTSILLEKSKKTTAATVVFLYFLLDITVFETQQQTLKFCVESDVL